MDLCKLLFENTTKEVAVIDFEYKLLFCNHLYKYKFKKLYNLEIEVGNDILKALENFPEVQSQTKNRIERALTGEAWKEVETKENGSCYKVRFEPLNDADGRVIAVYHSISNQKEKKQSMNSVLQDILNNSFDMVAGLDNEYRFIGFNRAYSNEFLRIWGFEVKLGMSLKNDIPKEFEAEASIAIAVWTRALKGESFRVVQEFVGNAKRTCYYEFAFDPILNHKGEVIGAGHICKNITERIEMEKEIKELNDRLVEKLEKANNKLKDKLEVILDTMGIGIWSWNMKDGKMTSDKKHHSLFDMEQFGG